MRFPFFRKKEKEIVDFSDNPEDDKEPRLGYKFQKFTFNPGRVPPGEILKLYYPRSGDKTVLVVSTDRAPRGNFISTQDNKLLCCFELNEDSVTFDIILKVFHKNLGRSRYRFAPGFLRNIFGLSFFKTLNIAKIEDTQLLIKEKQVKK